VASSSQPSNGARARYLSGLTPEQQVQVLLKAERLGPAANDEADWLVAQAASAAAAQITASCSDAAGRIEAASGQADIAAQLERIESRLKKKGPEPIITSPIRDLIVFAVALFTCVAVAVVCGVSPAAPIALIAAFVLGLCGALAYIWLAPMITRQR
jgi:hypothetical protein